MNLFAFFRSLLSTAAKLQRTTRTTARGRWSGRMRFYAAGNYRHSVYSILCPAWHRVMCVNAHTFGAFQTRILCKSIIMPGSQFLFFGDVQETVRTHRRHGKETSASIIWSMSSLSVLALLLLLLLHVLGAIDLCKMAGLIVGNARAAAAAAVTVAVASMPFSSCLLKWKGFRFRQRRHTLSMEDNGFVRRKNVFNFSINPLE